MPIRQAFFLAALVFASTLREGRVHAQAPATSPGVPSARVDTAEPGGATYSLDDALRVMRAQHPLLIAAEHAVSAARADRKATQLWTNPVLSGQYIRSPSHNTYDQAGYTTYGVSQFVELANAPAARARAANLLVLASKADYTSLVVELSLDVQAALIDVVTARRKVALVEQALHLLDAAAKIVDQRVLAGATPRYDSTRIAVTTAGAHADYDSLRADAARAQAELLAAVGPGAGSLHGQPDYPLERPLALPSPEALVELLLQQKPDLEAARQRAAAAKASIDATRRSIFPGVSVSAVGGFGNAPGQLDFGVGLTVPLPVVDRGQGIVAGAEARALQARSYADAVLVPARARIYGMHAEIVARQHAYDAYTGRAVASGDEMLQEAQAGYLAGRFSVLELVDAYVSWRDSRLRAVDLAAAVRNAEVDLSHALGVRLPTR